MRSELKAQLSSRLAPIVSKRGSVALGVWGELGIGKSHLVQEVLRGLSCRTVTVQAGLELERIPELLPRSAGKEFTRPNPRRQAQTVLGVLAENAPVVLHLEDFQNLALERLELLRQVVLGLAGVRGVGLVFSGQMRPFDEVESWRLEPLPEAELRAVLSETQVDLPEAALLWLLERAAGNPLVAAEYLRWLIRQGALWNDGQGWRWREPAPEIPTSLEGMMGQFLQGQPLHLLAARALLPSSADVGLWATVAGVSEAGLREVARRLEQVSILRGSAFSHPLLATVIGSGVPHRLRHELAARALPLLLESGQPDYIEAGAALIETAPPDRALELLLEAAGRLRGLGKPLEAARLLAQATEYAAGGQRGALALEAAGTLRHADLAAALRMAELAYRQDARAETLLLYAELLTLNGQPAAAEALLLRLTPQALDQQWLPRLIGLRVQQTAFAEALELWRNNPQIHAAAPALTRRDVAWASMQFGELEAAEALLRQALAAQPSPYERALLLGARAHLETLRGRFLLAVQSASGAIALLGDQTPRDLARAYEFRAMARQYLGRFAEAAADSEQALRLRRGLGDGWGVAQAQMSLAPVLLELAQYERAEEILLNSQGLYVRAEAKEPLIHCLCQLTYLYLEWPASHSAALALKHARAATLQAQTASPMSRNQALAHRALAEAKFGDPQAALKFAAQAEAVAEGMGQPDSVSLETLARAIAAEATGDLPQAIQLYAKAVEMFRQDGLVTAERFALELYRLRQDPASAQQRLLRFQQLGYLHAARLAQHYFGLEKARPEPQSAPLLRVLGSVRVLLGGQPVRLHSSQGRAFLAYLLEARIAGRDEVPDLELLDAFWPELPEAKAKVALKQLVYRLRKSLGSAAVVRTPRGYALGEVASDAEAFLQNPDVSLWRGPYLEDLDEGTDLEEGGDVRSALYQALMLQTQGLLEADPKGALRLGRILMQADPYNRQMIRLTCQALHRLGNRRDLAKVYAQARRRLAEVGESLPESWQGFLKADG